jgi:hypothetical protein
MSVRIRAALVASLAVGLVAPAAAAANSITTGKAESNGHDSTNLYAAAQTSCDGKISFHWGSSPDNLSNTRTHPLTTHPPGNSAIDDIAVTPGATYYYRAVFTADCGNAEGVVRCFVHSENVGDQENAACPNDPGEPGSGGGGGGDTGGGGSTNPPPGPKYIHPKGKDCIVPVKIGYVTRDIIAQHVKCKAIVRILDGKKARNQIGRKRVVGLAGFRCVALNRNHGSAEYHCKSGGKGWYMRTYAAGSWKVPGEDVYVDW